jgi:molecular chaperone GrpE
MWWKRLWSSRSEKASAPAKKRRPRLPEQLAEVDRALARLAREQAKANLLWEQSSKQQAELVAGLEKTLTQQEANYRALLAQAEERGRTQWTQRLFPQLLAFLDDLMQAAAAMEQQVSQQPALAEWAGGVRRLHNRGEELLSLWNVTPIPAMGQPFDPSVHRPVDVVFSSEVTQPIVVAEVQRGYRQNGELLRQATVVVAKPANSTTGTLEASV